MAIYHLSVKTVSRSAGRSAPAAAAYRAGEKIVDDRTGTTHDYTRKRGIDGRGIVLPEGAPPSFRDRSTLWNEAEKAETRKNSTVAREFEIALPSELDRQQRRELVQAFARAIARRHRCAVDVAIHRPTGYGDQRNHHAHLMLTTRRITPEGFGEKTRELDERKSGEIDHWREKWASMANRALEGAGVEVRIDHRTLEAQQIDREPTRHLGPKASAMERCGTGSDRGDENRAIRADNDNRVLLSAEIVTLRTERERGYRETTEKSINHAPVREKERTGKESPLQAALQRPSGVSREASKGKAEWKSLDPVVLKAEIQAQRKRLDDERQAEALKSPLLPEARDKVQALEKKKESVSERMEASIRESAVWRQKSPRLAWLHDKGWFENRAEKKRQDEQVKARGSLKDIDFQKNHWMRVAIKNFQQKMGLVELRQGRERAELSRMEADLECMERARRVEQERERQKAVEEAARQRSKTLDQKPGSQEQSRKKPDRGMER